MTPTDIRRQVVVEELDLAGDGSTAVIVRRIIERDTYLGHLHTKSLDTGGRPNQITSGRVRDTSPRISPDGSQVAFLRSFPDHAEGSRPPIALSPELDRPFGNATDTDLTGWMVYGRYGPTWLDNRTIVAVISDRGRSLPERWVIDPTTGSPVDVPVASDRASHGPWADATTHMVAVGGGVVATVGTLHGRAPELMTVDLARPAGERQFASHTTFWFDRYL